MSFFAELKRRSVYKVAVVYAKPEPPSNFGVRRSALDVGLRLRRAYGSERCSAFGVCLTKSYYLSFRT